jgi:signal transduction histidine kinase
MRSPTLAPTRDPVIRMATRTSLRLRPISRRLDTHAQRPERTLAQGDLVHTAHRTAEVAVHDERRRLARELHDSVAQTLYGITLSASCVLELLERSETEQVHTIVSEMLRLANDGQTELRTLVHDLRPDELFQFQEGLTGALASLATGLEARAGCQVRLLLADEPDIALSTKATLARIAQEALHNIAKHARATHVDLVLEVGPADVMLLVADDGRGFDAHAAHPGHFGLQLMCEQAMAVGAALELVSARGRGTQVRVRVGRRRR